MRIVKPHKLLDTIIAEFKLKNDAALCRLLEIDKGQISKLRNGRLRVNATHVLHIHDVTGWEIKRIKQLAGVA